MSTMLFTQQSECERIAEHNTSAWVSCYYDRHRLMVVVDLVLPKLGKNGCTFYRSRDPLN